MKTWIARSAGVAAATVLAGSLGVTAAAAAPAHPAAPHSDCKAKLESMRLSPTKLTYRVAAECTYLEPDVKARGVLDLALQTDAHTPWFTETGVVYYSPWKTPIFYERGVRMEYARR